MDIVRNRDQKRQPKEIRAEWYDAENQCNQLGFARCSQHAPKLVLCFCTKITDNIRSADQQQTKETNNFSTSNCRAQSGLDNGILYVDCILHAIMQKHCMQTAIHTEQSF